VTTAPGVIAHLLFAYVVLAEPLLGHRLYAAVRRSVKEDRRARARFYRWSIASEWLWVAVNALLLSGEALSLRELGLRLPGGESSPSTAGIVIGLVGGLVLLVVVTRVKARRSGQYGWLLPRSALEPFVELLPTTGRERRLFAALALTAGVVATIASAAIFGAAHFYQGWRGVLLTSLLGFGLARLYLSTGTLLLPILAHALIDLRFLLLWRSRRAA